ncbi:MAG: amidohydrolase/deacetylase family metallohydrolase [Phycisphaerae bacterium]|nr:amidohydrolase/deacetylase family metallohydrolase [Phycisphaerae bacterium]
MSRSLRITGGRVFDGERFREDMEDVCITDGRFVKPDEVADSAETVNAAGLMVVPGLIDMHAHVFEGVTIGISADEHFLAKGVTTVCDAGSAGANTYPAFEKFIVGGSRCRVKAFLHVSCVGLAVMNESAADMGELEEIRFIRGDAAYRMVEERPGHIVGIKVRTSEFLAHGQDKERAGLWAARSVADRAGLPLMVHYPGSSLPEEVILSRLRPGDILTHIYHPWVGGPLGRDGKVMDVYREAKDFGVVLDLGHGRGAFSFEAAERCLDQGFVPDTISTDLYTMNVDGPVYDTLTTMDKMLVLGMPMEGVLQATTSRPAEVIGMDGEIGRIGPGYCGDVTLLAIEERPSELRDVMGGVRQASQRLACRGVIRGGDVEWLSVDARG